MRNLLIVVAALTIATVAMSASPPPVAELIEGQVPRPDGIHVGSKNQPVKVDGVLYIDQRAAGGNNGGGCDGGPGICFSGQGALTWDFIALTGQPATIHTKCSISDAGAAPGCLLGDTVLLGSTVSPPVTHGTLEARLTANEAFSVIACATGVNDGGTFDMPATTFKVRCFR